MVGKVSRGVVKWEGMENRMPDKKTLDLSASAPANTTAASDAPLETALPPPQGVEPRGEEARTQDRGGEGAPSGPEIQQGMLSLLEEMQQLRRDFDTKVKYDESKERQITLLHEELRHRDNLHFTILRPVLDALIALYDDMSKMLEGDQEADPLTSNQWRKNLESIQATVEEILRQNGVEAFSVEGMTVTPERQRIMKAIITDDLSRDKQIARRLRRGFLYETRVLRPEWVEVYRYLAKDQD